MNTYKLAFAKAVEPLVNVSLDTLLDLIEVPPDNALGDFALPCFIFAKEKKKAPNQIAQDLAKEVQLPTIFRELKINGPYLNVFLNMPVFSNDLLHKIFEKKGLFGRGKSNGVIGIEFPGPNTNKPLHIGHLRNLLLGMSVARLLEFNGFIVKRVNINNDRGIHICKSMLAYQKWGEGKDPDKKSDHFIGDFYVLFARKFKEHPELEEEAKTMLRAWEAKDATVRALWKKMRDWALKGFQQTYKQFNLVFDKEYFESDIYEKAKEIVQKGLDKGVFIRDETGAIIAPLKAEGLSDKYILRADGTSVYITQDLYLAFKRFEDFKMDKMIYVVATEQTLHFKQLFALLAKLNYPAPEGLHHLSYGMVNLPEGKMKSREGNVVDLDDLIDEILSLAKQSICKRHKELSAEEIEKRARSIAFGAINFFMLKFDKHKDFVFDPKKSLAFEGETGVYVQYTHARIASILRSNKTREAFPTELLLTHTSEEHVIRILAKFPGIVDLAAKQYRPELVARYMFDLAQAFTAFYHNCPVLKAEGQTKNSRIALLQCVQIILQSGLALLGIDAPEAI